MHKRTYITEDTCLFFNFVRGCGRRIVIRSPYKRIIICLRVVAIPTASAIRSKIIIRFFFLASRISSNVQVRSRATPDDASFLSFLFPLSFLAKSNFRFSVQRLPTEMNDNNNNNRRRREEAKETTDRGATVDLDYSRTVASNGKKKKERKKRERK